MTDKPDHEAATAWAKVIKRQKRLHPSLRDEDAINLARCYLERCAELAAAKERITNLEEVYRREPRSETEAFDGGRLG